jgi:hypothetical protein
MPLAKKVAAVQEIKPLKNRKQLRRFREIIIFIDTCGEAEQED